jgi:hypothetical protein
MVEEEHEQENSPNHEEIEEVEASIVSGDESEIEVTEEEFAQFIGKKPKKYLPKFKKFKIDGRDKFVVTWNWSAFFFIYIWLAFRKMYSWTAISLLFYWVGFWSLIPIIHPEGKQVWYPILYLLSALIVRIALMIAFGIAGNYLYYKRAKRKITKWKGSDMTKPLPKLGGVSFVAGTLAVAVFLPLEILFLGAWLSQTLVF